MQKDAAKAIRKAVYEEIDTALSRRGYVRQGSDWRLRLADDYIRVVRAFLEPAAARQEYQLSFHVGVLIPRIASLEASYLQDTSNYSPAAPLLTLRDFVRRAPGSNVVWYGWISTPASAPEVAREGVALLEQQGLRWLESLPDTSAALIDAIRMNRVQVRSEAEIGFVVLLSAFIRSDRKAFSRWKDEILAWQTVHPAVGENLRQRVEWVTRLWSDEGSATSK